jgi:hypothetical protein
LQSGASDMSALPTAGMHETCLPHGPSGTRYQPPLACEAGLELPSLPVSAAQTCGGAEHCSLSGIENISLQLNHRTSAARRPLAWLIGRHRNAARQKQSFDWRISPLLHGYKLADLSIPIRRASQLSDHRCLPLRGNSLSGRSRRANRVSRG